MAFTQNSINNTLSTTALTGTLAIGLFANNVITYAKLQPTTGGSILLGNPTGTPGNLSEITLGSNLSFAGTVLNSSGGFAPMPTSVVTGTSQSAATNTAYVTNNAALCTVTLPTTAAVGDEQRVIGLGAGGWKIAQNSGQLINFGNQVTTTGVGGSLASSNQFDTIHLKCTVANTTWSVVSSQGNIAGV